jgi:hypothetical protein
MPGLRLLDLNLKLRILVNLLSNNTLRLKQSLMLTPNISSGLLISSSFSSPQSHSYALSPLSAGAL